MGTAEKVDTQAEREVTRNRLELIHPSCEHASVTGESVCLAPLEGNVPRVGRTQIGTQHLGPPRFLAALSQTDPERLNLSQMWSITETRMS